MTLTFRVYHGVSVISNNLIDTRVFHLDGTREQWWVWYLDPGQYLVTASYTGYNFTCHFEILQEGCTDSDATNYDPEATIDNGSCEYPVNTCPEITGFASSGPVCPNQDGSIYIFANGPDIEFSITGRPWQSSAYFTGLTTGTYSASVRNTETGCSDSGSVTLSCTEDNSCPVITGISVGSNPSTCGASDGWFTINANGGNNEYSADGGDTWQGSPTFTGMSAQTYPLSVRNTDQGCSDNGTVTLSCTASCSDGRRNGGETGVDCGGPCAPCCPEDISVSVATYPYCPSGIEG
ncbi:MAG: hypothetical protein L3J79_09965, partial [Candidatus Marinimicrobia bacterium]|nr:hypothetical protein [Candidatus Neomarinimicrobiota bacterium]